MRTVLITLIGPERTTDLVVDADSAVQALLPRLLVAGGVPDTAREQAGWGIALMGKQPIERDSTLEQSGVLHGRRLDLRSGARARCSRARRPPTRPAGA